MSYRRSYGYNTEICVPQLWNCVKFILHQYFSCNLCRQSSKHKHMLLYIQLCCVSINCQKDLCLLDNEQNLGHRKVNVNFIMYMQSQGFIKTKPKRIVVYRLIF